MEIIKQNQERLQTILDEIEIINQEMQDVGMDEKENPILLRNTLRKFSSYLARVDVLYAETEAILSIARAYWSESLDAKIQATRFKEILEGKVALEQKAFRLAERTHKTLNTIITANITNLSFLKEELKQTQAIGQ